MTLLPHLISVFGLKGAIVEVTFHPPLTAMGQGRRKALADACYRCVSAGVADAHRRRAYAVSSNVEALLTVD
ncbi:MAG: hypothetical protein VW268_09585 [Rhodospirillaceae bacterium]